MNTILPEDVFATWPTVCAVGHEYQIMIPVKKETLMWCEAGGKTYYDESNGILRSATPVHRITIPQDVMDAAGGYTVKYQVVIERLPYFSKVEDPQELYIPFRGVSKNAENLKFYQIADSHSMIEPPVDAASYWGDDIDFLIMNGDIPDDCGSESNIASVFQISGRAAKGRFPVIFSRGNHDLRGILAEKYAEYTPSCQGHTYYTVRLGPVWAVILDCGEDKTDDHKEYGCTICCHDFRVRETEFLKEMVTHPESEFAAPDVKLRLVIAHNPFPQTLEEPFGIEVPLFTEWCNVLKESVKPDLMICGHIHQCYVIRPGDPLDMKGTPCPVVVASKPNVQKRTYIGLAVDWKPGLAKIFYTDHTKAVTGSDEIPLNE